MFVCLFEKKKKKLIYFCVIFNHFVIALLNLAYESVCQTRGKSEEVSKRIRISFEFANV